MTSDLTVTVNDGGRADVAAGTIGEAVRRTVLACGSNTGDFSITLLDDEEIRAMNAEYLQRNHPTDVIAFSLGDADRPLGDVYLGYEQAVRQAGDAGVSLEEELTRLAIHGVLHVFGHDHPEGPERVESPMYELQERLVREVFGA